MENLFNVLSMILCIPETHGRKSFNDGSSLWRYGDDKDFQLLWENVGSARGTIFILWDVTPFSTMFYPVDVAKHLTPLHWAACAAKFNPEGVDIWVIDMAPLSRSNTDKYYNEYRRYKSEEFNFLHVVTPDELLLSDNLLSHLPQYTHTSDAESRAERLLDIAKTLMFRDADRDGRHALSNAIGPLLLMPQGYLSEDPHAIGLRTLLQTFGILCFEADQVQPSVIRGWPEEPLDAFLIDDMAPKGWAEWLALQLKHMTGTKREVMSLATKKDIFERVSYLLKLNANVEGKLFTQAAQIYFVDLRLFPSDESGRREERSFFSEILSEWERFYLDSTKLPWEGGFDILLKEVKEWLKATPEADDYGRDAARLLLPAMLAQLNPLAPVILFSSSTDKKVVLRLATFGNILTSFSKPALFGPNMKENVMMAQLGLRNSLQSALLLLRVRQRSKLLVALDQENPKQAIDKKQKIHVELFLDESGTTAPERIDKVGGVLSVHVGTNPELDARTFDDIALQNGLRFFDNPWDLEPQISTGKPILKKRHSYKQCIAAFKAARQAFAATGKTMYLGFIVLKATPIVETKKADETYWWLVRVVIELFLTESLPAIQEHYSVQPQDMSYSIYAGTRVAKLMPGYVSRNYSSGFWVQPWADEGIKKTQTLSHHDIFWIARLVIRDHQSTNREYTRVRTVGIPIDYGTWRGKQQCAIRYGDEIFELAKDNDGKYTDAALEIAKRKQVKSIDRKELRYDKPCLIYIADQALNKHEPYGFTDIPGTFNCDLDMQLLSAMQASVLLDQNDLAAAAVRFNPCSRETGARALIGKRIGRTMRQRLKGSDIMRMQQLLAVGGQT